MNKESFNIQGLGGAKTLNGTIRINGAKNAALKAMAAAVLFDGPVELHNIPDTEDIHTMTEILEKLGAQVTHGASVKIDPTNIDATTIDPKLAAIMRASIVLTGPLLARYGRVTFPAPGGCVIGARPIDQFLKGYEKMGAVVTENDCSYTIEFGGQGEGDPGSLGLVAGGMIRDPGVKKDITIDFEMITVGGTETLMMAAVLGNGTVTLNNCAQEPEIVNVAEWLNECGAHIIGAGTDTISVRGTAGKLLSPITPYTAIPDRIEAGSYLILGALCAEQLTIENCRPDHLKVLIDLLIQSGVPIKIDNGDVGNGRNGSISIIGNTKPNAMFRPFDVSTREYPGFPTDLQAQIVTYLTQVTGKSTVVENIFEGRFKYIDDLQRIGAGVTLDSSSKVSITGPQELRVTGNGENAANLLAHDIRAGFAIVMAALVAEGIFTVSNVYFIDRGYEKMEEKLRALGAKIDRVQSR